MLYYLRTVTSVFMEGHQEEGRWRKVLEGGTAQAELHQGYGHVVLLGVSQGPYSLFHVIIKTVGRSPIEQQPMGTGWPLLLAMSCLTFYLDRCLQPAVISLVPSAKVLIIKWST